MQSDYQLKIAFTQSFISLFLLVLNSNCFCEGLLLTNSSSMVLHQQVKGMSRDNLLGSLFVFFTPKPVLTAWDLLERNIQQGGKTYLLNVMYRIHHSSLHPRFAGHTQTWRLRGGDNPARQRACVCVYRVFISTHAHL